MKALFPLLLAFALLGCSDDEAERASHLYHPQWTPNQSMLVSLYSEDVGSGTVTGIFTRRLSTWEEQRHPVPLHSAEQPFWVTPQGSAVGFAWDSVIFRSMTGEVLGSPTLSAPFVGQGFLSLLPNASAWFYAGRNGNRLVVGRVEYTGQPWTLTSQQVYLDTVTSARPLGLTFTGLFSCLVRLDDGTLLEVGEQGSFASLALAPVSFPDYWQARFHLYRFNTGLAFDQGRTNLKVYFRDGKGIHILTLADFTKTLIIEGSVGDFDVNDQSREIVYDTGTHDLWLGTASGFPLLRFAPPKHTMGAFGPDGRRIAAVAHVNGARDSLRIIRN